jgi:two-component system, NarL family, nitrate/nitrite response regulator NarL
MLPSSSVSVILISWNTLAREGLRRILVDEGFDVVASMESGKGFVDSKLSSIDPNLIIIDQCDSETMKLEFDRLASVFPRARTLVLADEFDFNDVVDAFRHGVDGYVVKKVGCESLIGSINLVAIGEKVMPSQLAIELCGHIISRSIEGPKPGNISELLSDRETETLRYLLVGHPNKVIANRLDVSEATVKVHVKAILRKLRVQNRTQAAIWAVNNGLDLGMANVAQMPSEQLMSVAG